VFTGRDQQRSVGSDSATIEIHDTIGGQSENQTFLKTDEERGQHITAHEKKKRETRQEEKRREEKKEVRSEQRVKRKHDTHEREQRQTEQQQP
jgi:hypothetical protein